MVSVIWEEGGHNSKFWIWRHLSESIQDLQTDFCNTMWWIFLVKSTQQSKGEIDTVLEKQEELKDVIEVGRARETERMTDSRKNKKLYWKGNVIASQFSLAFWVIVTIRRNLSRFPSLKSIYKNVNSAYRTKCKCPSFDTLQKVSISKVGSEKVKKEQKKNDTFGLAEWCGG